MFSHFDISLLLCLCFNLLIFHFHHSTTSAANLVVGVAHIVQRTYEILLASSTYRHDQHTHEQTCSVCVYDAERKRERICGGNGVALFVNVSVLLASQHYVRWSLHQWRISRFRYCMRIRSVTGSMRNRSPKQPSFTRDTSQELRNTSCNAVRFS